MSPPATPEQLAPAAVAGAAPASAPEPSPSAYQRFMATRTFGSLDGLRAIAIVAVVWHHTIEGFAAPITRRGFLGVDLFFVISGFLIVTLLLRERRRTGTVSLRGFYIRRVLRIFPPYYAVLLVVWALAVLKPGSSTPAVLHDLPYALFYGSNMVDMLSLLSITWSLSTEEQFYLVIPALEKFGRRALPVVLPAAYALVSALQLGAFLSLPLPRFFRETTFGPILLGVMLAHLMDDPRAYRWIGAVLGRASSPLLGAALVVAACLYPGDDISGWPRISIHLAMAALVASCVAQERHALTPVLSSWALRRIGIVSYGIYLLHMIVRHVVDKGMGRAGLSSRWLFFAATVLGTWGVAELSYRYFESRFLRLRSRFAS